MRNDLYGLTQIIAMTLLGDHGKIHFACGNATVLGQLGGDRDLAALAGRWVIVQFHFGSDSNTPKEGWYVDDACGNT